MISWPAGYPNGGSEPGRLALISADWGSAKSFEFWEIDSFYTFFV